MLIHGARPKTEPEVVKARLADLAEEFARFTDLLHKFDGTMPGAEFGGSEMRTAHGFLNTAWLWAKEAIEKN